MGLIAEIAYNLCRNVLYPIMNHKIFARISFFGYLSGLTKNATITVGFTLIVLITLLIGLRNWIYVIKKYKNDLEVNWVQTIKGKSTINIVPGLFGFIITFVTLIMLLIVGHLYIGILTDAELIIAIIMTGFYGILFTILFWLATKTEYVSPSQNTSFTGPKVLTESDNTR